MILRCQVVHFQKKLEKNDVNFLVSLNLLAAWEKSDAEYKRVLKLMQKPSLNFYPNLKEQFFLFDKGDYIKYYEKNPNLSHRPNRRNN